MEDGWAVTDRLVGLGLDPLGIELVVLTHMHQDHVGAVAQLPRATFVVDGREWKAATDSGFLHGYRRQLYDHDYDWRALDFAAPPGRLVRLLRPRHRPVRRRLGAAALDAGPHEGAHERAAAPAVGARAAAHRRRRVLAGDHRRSELVPLFCDDVHRYLRSLREIRRYLELTPSALVVCGHDPESWPQVLERYE